MLLVSPPVGCRAIRRIGDTRQSVDARKLSRTGVQAMHRGKWNDAEQLFTAALALSDADDRAHRGLAEAYWNRGQHEAAIEHMEKAVQLSASDPRLVGRLGEMYLESGRIADAETQSEIALATERNSAAIWVLRGDCLNEKGCFEEALAAYHRALSLQPDFGDAKLRVAELYLQNDQYDRLLATLDQIEIVPESNVSETRIHMLRGIAMRNLDRPDQASKHFAEAIRSDPTAAEPHLQIAAIEIDRGRAHLASESVARAMALDRELTETSGWSNYLIGPQEIVASEDDEDPLR